MTGQCERCGADLVGESGFVTWCPACDWNVDPLAGRSSTPKRSRLERFELAMARRTHLEVLADTVTRPRPGWAGVALMAFCVLVLLWHVVLVAAGVVLLVVSEARVFSLLFAVPLIVSGAYPFFAGIRRRRGVVACPRDRFPALYGLVAEVAAAGGSPMVRRIELAPDFNASAARSLRGRRLTIGLPLWMALRADERIFVIGHELGHFRNGDLRRGRLVGVALGALSEWHTALVRTRGFGAFIAMLFSVPVELALLVADRLAFVTSQRGEYYADRQAARVASTEAGVRALAVVRSGGPTAQLAWQKGAPDATAWERVGQRFADLPHTEVARRVRAAELDQELEPDSTHPPIGFRIDALRAHPDAGDPGLAARPVPVDPGFVAAGEELARILRHGR